MTDINFSQIRADFEAALPPFIARVDIHRYTPYKPKTMEAYDSRGIGVKNSFKQGRKVIYRKADLINWLISRMEVTDGQSTDK